MAQLAHVHPAARLSVLCEEPEAVGQIPAELSIFVDVNPGMNRTGVALADPARILGIARRAGKRFRGIHFYEGHITQGTYAERSQRAFAVYDRLMELVSVMRREGLPLEEIVTSGTPTFMPALAYQPFAELRATSHRVSPGTVVFHDARSAEDAPELELTPAAVVLSRVISHPAEDLVTCDAGSKSIAAEAGDPCAVVAGHAEWVAQKPSEEHLPLRVTKGPQPSRGTPLWLIPRHVCPTVNLAETAVLVENGRIVELASVSARAHETMLISTR